METCELGKVAGQPRGDRPPETSLPQFPEDAAEEDLGLVAGGGNVSVVLWELKNLRVVFFDVAAARLNGCGLL